MDYVFFPAPKADLIFSMTPWTRAWGHGGWKSNELEETGVRRRKARALEKPDREDAETEKRDAERRVDSDRAGVDYLCMLRLLGAVCQPVTKFRNEPEFRKWDFPAGRTTRPP